MNKYASALIGFDEGDVGKPYQDSRGIWTIGKGHNLEANGLPPGIFHDAITGLPWSDCLDFLNNRGGITADEDAALFTYDENENCAWLFTKPWWGNLDEERQAALEDMSFNLGPARMQKFVTFLGLIAGGDYAAAAQDLEFNTAVGTELPKRYGRLEQIIRTGSIAGILPGV